MDRSQVETKLSAARTRLILERPFLGALVLRLPLAPAPEWCATSGTDARRIYYNPSYIASLSPSQVEFVLAHEALHCGLSHFARRGHRIKRRWDMACDYAVNVLLAEEGLEPPPGALVEPGFSGMSAEEIYPCILELEDEEPLDDHLYDGKDGDAEASGGGEGGASPDQGSSQGSDQGADPGSDQHQPAPPPLSAAERETLQAQWRQRLAAAAQQAAQAGKLRGGLARLAEALLQPKVPWRAMLAQYMSAVARDDYSYTRPSSRRGGEAIFPSLRSPQLEVVVAVDTSGSVDDKLLSEFLAEIDALKGQVRARVTLVLCDAALSEHGPVAFEPWEPAAMPEWAPRAGGTRFVPVFEWIDRQDRRPELLVYFTDALGEFPAQAPDYPVVWLVKGKAPVPWGQRVQLN